MPLIKSAHMKTNRNYWLCHYLIAMAWTCYLIAMAWTCYLIAMAWTCYVFQFDSVHF